MKEGYLDVQRRIDAVRLSIVLWKTGRASESYVRVSTSDLGGRMEGDVSGTDSHLIHKASLLSLGVS